MQPNSRQRTTEKRPGCPGPETSPRLMHTHGNIFGNCHEQPTQLARRLNKMTKTTIEKTRLPASIPHPNPKPSPKLICLPLV